MRVSLFRRGPVWWANYRLHGRRFRVSLDTENRKAADDECHRLEARLRSGGQPQERQKTPIAEFRKEYEEHSKAIKRPKSHETDIGRLDAFFDVVKAAFVQDVTTRDVEAFLARKVNADESSPTTILRYREVLHAFFEVARKHGHVEKNPIADVARPRVPEKDKRFLSGEQIEALLKRVRKDLIHPLVASLIFAGLRREEACWLTWEDLELESTTPVLRVRAKSIGKESWLPKTKRDRTVPISPRLAEVLRRHRHGRNGVPWLFPSPEGCRWNPDNLSHRFRKLMKRKPKLPWNLLDLRHTFGSQLAQKGVSLLKIATLMGNSPAIAHKHYIRLVPENLAVDVAF